MPNIEISDPIFSRIQAYAVPLVDSIDTALAKILDIAESTQTGKVNSPNIQSVESGSAPDLTHTSITSVKVNGKNFPPAMCNWNAVMLAVIEQAASKLPKGTAMDDLIVVNHVSGQKEDFGYKFIKSVGLSVQGQNANNAWKAIAHLAKTTGVKVEVSFYWADHPKAAKPGVNAKLAI